MAIHMEEASVRSNYVPLGRVAAALLMMGCSGSTGPSAGARIVGHTGLSGSPFGTAATPAGVTYILRHTTNSASRFNLPSTANAGTFALDNNPTDVAFNPTGTVAYVTAQFANLVQVVNASSNAIIDSIPVTGNPFVVRVAPGDQSIWVSTNVDTLYQIDPATKGVLAAYAMPLVPNGLAFNPANDSMLYASTLSAGKVIEINYKRRTIGRTFSPGGTTQGVAVSADGTRLYVANETAQEVDAYDLGSGGSVGTVGTSGGAFDLKLSADGATIWVTNSDAGVVDGFNRITLAREDSIVTGGTPRRIAVTGANPIVVANEAGWVDFIK